MAVAETNADLMAKASRDAEEQATSLQKAVASFVQSESPQESLSLARVSMSLAREAYQQAEPSIFYVDPEAPQELASLPDPLRVGTPRSEIGKLGQMARTLQELESLTAIGFTKQVDPIVSRWLTLRSQTSSLRKELDRLADGWDEAEDSAFRQRFFLRSTPNAIARIFQGIIAVSGDLLPNYWLRPGGGWSDARPPLPEVIGRLRAIRNIYAGRAVEYGLAEGPGLFDLVQERAPEQAGITLRSVDNALLMAEQLALTPGDAAQARALLLYLSEEVTQSLIKSAGALDIVIVEEPQAP
jgi:hypothetical protein